MTFRRVFVFIGTLIATAAWGWSPADYLDTTATAFFRRPDVNKPIDFQHPDQALLTAAVFYETNLRREQAGVPDLRHSAKLDHVAWAHADDMVRYTYFSHTSPVTGLQTVQDRLASVGIRGGVQGENIARGFALDYQSGRAVYPPQDTGGGFRYTLKGPDLQPRTYAGLAAALLDQWIASPDHREVLLDRNFRFVGNGIVLYPATNFYNMEYFMAVADFSSEG
ncbi:MAG: CAP domain-containing protein [Spirochaetales bacterium]|nr:CAP domain-containing protein [Spirochaetales bacterium]